ncbi:MAG: hypothetical protein PHS02_02420 [Candidatus ainarchaeum sp.]|nr:hypothetical protein [Candidatus ainarchaeum sp.]
MKQWPTNRKLTQVQEKSPNGQMKDWRRDTFDDVLARVLNQLGGITCIGKNSDGHAVETANPKNLGIATLPLLVPGMVWVSGTEGPKERNLVRAVREIKQERAKTEPEGKGKKARARVLLTEEALRAMRDEFIGELLKHWVKRIKEKDSEGGLVLREKWMPGWKKGKSVENAAMLVAKDACECALVRIEFLIEENKKGGEVGIPWKTRDLLEAARTQLMKGNKIGAWNELKAASDGLRTGSGADRENAKIAERIMHMLSNKDECAIEEINEIIRGLGEEGAEGEAKKELENALGLFMKKRDSEAVESMNEARLLLYGNTPAGLALGLEMTGDSYLFKKTNTAVLLIRTFTHIWTKEMCSRKEDEGGTSIIDIIFEANERLMRGDQYRSAALLRIARELMNMRHF